MKRKHTNNNGNSNSKPNKRKFSAVDCPLDTVDGYLTQTDTMTVFSQSRAAYKASIRFLIDKYTRMILKISISCSPIQTHVQRRHRPKQLFPKIKKMFEDLNQRLPLNIIDRSAASAEATLSLSELENWFFLKGSTRINK
jgi:hypothetical protein